MQLTRAEFEARYQAGTLRIAFVGMSNIGKSYTAMRLATRYDFRLIEVDKLIWEELGQGSMADFAKWQGHPYTKGYAEREQRSKDLETKITKAAMRDITGNTILDTTGSVIHTDGRVQTHLKSNFYLIYIEASGEDINHLKSLYFKAPKPLIWADSYNKEPDETPEESILRCYPKLLKNRGKRYQSLADITVPSQDLIKAKSADEVFKLIKPPV